MGCTLTQDSKKDSDKQQKGKLFSKPLKLSEQNRDTARESDLAENQKPAETPKQEVKDEEEEDKPPAYFWI